MFKQNEMDLHKMKKKLEIFPEPVWICMAWYFCLRYTYLNETVIKFSIVFAYAMLLSLSFLS